MANALKKDIGKIIAEGTQIDEAVRQAVKEAVLKHKQAGNPIVAMRDGQMVWIKADEISV